MTNISFNKLLFFLFLPCFPSVLLGMGWGEEQGGRMISMKVGSLTELIDENKIKAPENLNQGQNMYKTTRIYQQNLYSIVTILSF